MDSWKTESQDSLPPESRVMGPQIASINSARAKAVGTINCQSVLKENVDK